MSEPDPLDGILSSEDALVPSSGFAGRVMDAVRDAAAEPPPLPFPWGRFALGVMAILASAASGFWLVRQVELAPVAATLSDVWPELGFGAAMIVGTLALLYAPYLRQARRRLRPPGTSPWTAPRG